MSEGTDIVLKNESVSSNISYIYRCKIPTVITETLIV
jgi:hypothetical protein